MATLLDPQFKTVPFLSHDEKLDAYHNLTVEAVSTSIYQKIKKSALKIELPNQPISAASEPDLPTMPGVPSPKMKEGTECDAAVSVVAETVKPTAMSALFGDVYITSVQKAKSNQKFRRKNPLYMPARILSLGGVNMNINIHRWLLLQRRTYALQQHLPYLKKRFQWLETM